MPRHFFLNKSQFRPNNTSSFVIAMAISTFASEFAYGLVFTVEHFIFGFEMFQTLKYV